jgi:hypothetical protein
MWAAHATTQTIYVSVAVQKQHVYAGTVEINIQAQQPVVVSAHKAGVEALHSVTQAQDHYSAVSQLVVSAAVYTQIWVVVAVLFVTMVQVLVAAVLKPMAEILINEAALAVLHSLHVMVTVHVQQHITLLFRQVYLPAMAVL